MIIGREYIFRFGLTLLLLVKYPFFKSNFTATILLLLHIHNVKKKQIRKSPFLYLCIFFIAMVTNEISVTGLIKVLSKNAKF